MKIFKINNNNNKKNTTKTQKFSIFLKLRKFRTIKYKQFPIPN